MGRRCVKFGVITLTLSYWSLEVQHATSWQKLSEDLKKIIVALNKDRVSHKKFAKTLKFSCKTIQWFNRTSSTQNRPWSNKEVECTCLALSPAVVFGKIDVWVLPALL